MSKEIFVFIDHDTTKPIGVARMNELNEITMNIVFPEKMPDKPFHFGIGYKVLEREGNIIKKIQVNEISLITR